MPKESTDIQTDIHSGVENIADELLSEMSAPQQHAIDQAAESQETESVTDSSAKKDDAGSAWNPDIHATGKDGRGVKTATGQWRQRRGAGTRKSTVGHKADVPPVSSNEQAARVAGVACAHSILMMGTLLGGAEWQPRIIISEDGKVQLNEAEMMEKAWGDYFVAKGQTEFPPGLALTMALSAYALPRFTMPQTRSRMQKAKEWIAAKYAKWKVRKKPKDAPDQERKSDTVTRQPTK